MKTEVRSQKSEVRHAKQKSFSFLTSDFCLLFSVLCLLTSVFFTLSGCQQVVRHVMPVHDEVLVFNKAMDYTYLRVIDAILATPDWSIYETNKREGMVRAYNMKYADPFAPLDSRVATFYVKPLSRRRSSLEVARPSQTLIGLDRILKSIKESMNR